MKQITLTCSRCGRRNVFFGRSVDEAIASIDSSGWIDRQGGQGADKDTCDDCVTWEQQKVDNGEGLK